MHKNVKLLNELTLSIKQRQIRTKICITCNKEFLDLTKRHLSNTCSQECQNIQMVKTRRERNNYICSKQTKICISNTSKESYHIGQYTRDCPLCNKIIHYNSLIHCNNASKKQTLCKSCAELGNKNHFYGKHYFPGKKYNWLGKTHTKETIQKISNVLKGKPFSNKHLKNLRQSQKNKKHPTEESKLKQSQTMANKIAIGEFDLKTNSRGIKSKYFSQKTQCYEHCDSNLERFRMYQLDNDNNVITWTKKHGIKIPYINEFQQQRNYVPDFLIIYDNTLKIIEEVKGYETQNSKIKFLALQDYAIKNNFLFKWTTSLELEKQGSRNWILNNCKEKL